MMKMMEMMKEEEEEDVEELLLLFSALVSSSLRKNLPENNGGERHLHLISKSAVLSFQLLSTTNRSDLNLSNTFCRKSSSFPAEFSRVSNSNSNN